MNAPTIATRLGFALLLAAACTISPGALGQDVGSLPGKPSAEQILEALSRPTQAPHTRGLSLSSTNEVQEPTAKPQARAVDLDIQFEFNSDRLTDDGREVLTQLGQALNSEQLSGAKTIVLEGHTDTKGSALYNKLLSLRRAQSVKAFLASHEHVPATKLKAVGKGQADLADPKNPEDAVNRRVRVIVDG